MELRIGQAIAVMDRLTKRGSRTIPPAWVPSAPLVRAVSAIGCKSVSGMSARLVARRPVQGLSVDGRAESGDFPADLHHSALWSLASLSRAADERGATADPATPVRAERSARRLCQDAARWNARSVDLTGCPGRISGESISHLRVASMLAHDEPGPMPVAELNRRGHRLEIFPRWSHYNSVTMAARDGHMLCAAASPRRMQCYAIGR